MALSSLPHFSRTLRFWRDFEIFLPFQLDDIFDYYEETCLIRFGQSEPLPWEDASETVSRPDLIYAYDLFLAPFALASVPEVLARCIPGVAHEQLPDPRAYEGRSCYLRLALSEKGVADPTDMSVSTLPWALAQKLSGSGISMQNFDLHCQEILDIVSSKSSVVSEFADDTSDPEEQEPNFLKLADLEQLATFLSTNNELDFFPGSLLAVAARYPIGKRKPQQKQSAESTIEASGSAKPETSSEKLSARSKRKVDILNSFFLRDLERVFLREAEISADSPLGSYLDAPIPTEDRVDILTAETREVVLSTVCSSDIPLGRWPADLSHSLALGQRFGLHQYLFGGSSLSAINGPPGTGKTTLIRDLVAHLVTARALELAKFELPGDAFNPTKTVAAIGARLYNFRTLRRSLLGYELVVASSNNAAVENISLSLPSKSALGDQYQNLSYLRPVALLYEYLRNEMRQGAKNQSTSLSEMTSWGLPSAALGNSAKRRLFRSSAFYFPVEREDKLQERQSKGELLTLFELRNKALPGAISYFQARKQFVSAYRALAQWQEAQNRLAFFERSSIPVSGSLEWHTWPGHFDVEVNQLQTNCFIAALALHEAWIREVPFLETELRTLSALITQPHLAEPEAARELWPLLCMLVPLISTTLASVERMFAQLPAGSLGHVVLEEAGQATPQSVAGTLMRAKRALVIGDQRQLEPVVISSQALEAELARELLPDERKRYSPLGSSAQAIADSRSVFGTSLSNGLAPELWVGSPLCVHRRSASPMFELSNEIAYDQMMVRPAMPNHSHPILGPTSWIQVKGQATAKQWVPEQGQVAKELLRVLLSHSNSSPSPSPSQCPDVFFISPFREVRDRLKAALLAEAQKLDAGKELRRQIRLRVGTVHTFQGKEAEVVILVLGCDGKTQGAANWAGERPNLLNVAVSRAKHLLYVVGDADLWHNRGYFSELEKRLPRFEARELFG